MDGICSKGGINYHVVVNAILMFESKDFNLAIDKQIPLESISFNFGQITNPNVCLWKTKHLHNLQYDMKKAALQLNVEIFILPNNDQEDVHVLANALRQIGIDCAIVWQHFN